MTLKHTWSNFYRGPGTILSDVIVIRFRFRFRRHRTAFAVLLNRREEL
jgi:hypothetical protein